MLFRSEGQWVVDIELPELELTPYETLHLDKAELKSLRSRLPRSAVTLDVEYDLTDLYRAGAGQRGVHQAIALWVRSAEDVARQVVRFAMPDRCHALTSGLIGIIRDDGVIPGVVRVASNDIYAFYEPLAKTLGFKLVKVDRLESVEKAYEKMNNSGGQMSLF